MFIELFRGKKGWKWRIKGGNGETVAVAQKYVSRSSAIRTSKTLLLYGFIKVVELDAGKRKTIFNRSV